MNASIEQMEESPTQIGARFINHEFAWQEKLKILIRQHRSRPYYFKIARISKKSTLNHFGTKKKSIKIKVFRMQQKKKKIKESV